MGTSCLIKIQKPKLCAQETKRLVKRMRTLIIAKSSPPTAKQTLAKTSGLEFDSKEYRTSFKTKDQRYDRSK